MSLPAKRAKLPTPTPTPHPPPHPPPPSSSPLPGSFYQRELPLQCVNLCDTEGKLRFQQALAAGNANAFFPLVSQFRTQDKPAYCGLASLTMVLNALRIDPKVPWRGSVWRWYSEEQLEC
eukprot:UC1_evm1s1025